MVVGYHHFRKPPYSILCLDMSISSLPGPRMPCAFRSDKSGNEASIDILAA